MLRARLMLGLGCLLIIVLAMGVYSINQCSELGERIQKIGRDHGEVGKHLQQMKRGGADMTAALLTMAIGDGDKSRADFQASEKNFQDALDLELSRVDASPDEVAVTKKLTTTYKDYTEHARAFLLQTEKTDKTWRADATKLGQDTIQILDLVDELYTVHQKSVNSTGTSARDINQTIRFLMLMMLIAVAAFIAAYFGLSHGLLVPLKSLAASIKLVGEGNLDQTVPVVSKDELGLLAGSFNKMAARLREYQANTSVELLRLNQTIRATLASFPDPVFVLNSEGAVEFRNPVADQLAVKLLFAGVTRLPAKVDDKVEEVLAQGEDYLPTSFQEAVKFHIDGQDRYFLPRVVLLRTEKGETFGVAVILENVTRMLLLDDVKSNLIATVSHELKTPLTSVRMALYLLHERTVGQMNEKQSDLVAAAREDADRLLKTLNDLLDLAKLEHGSTQIEVQEAAPEMLVETTERAMRDTVHAAGMTLKTVVEAGLPIVKIDPQRIAYVYSNLVNNAVKYSPSGGTVTLSAEKGTTRSGKAGVRFSVQDEGPGITPEHQEHVFERFYRIPGTNRTGAGLGLSIAREIVSAHQGEIGVISQPGQGSKFSFVLPV